MIIVDRDTQIWDLLEKSKITDEISTVRLDEMSYEVSNGLEDEIIFAHESVFDNLLVKSKLEKSLCLIVYSEKKLSLDSENIIAVINDKTDLSLLTNLIKKFDSLSREQQVLKSQLMTINSDINEIMGNVEVELLKVKRLYEMKAPKRTQEFKGLKVFSKYNAGENLGGEFFDIHHSQNKLLVLMSSTNSYLVSSSILNIFSDTKDSSEYSVENILSQIFRETYKINESKKNKVELELSLFEVDLATLTIDGYMLGNFSFVSSSLEKLYSKKTCSSFLASELEEFRFSTSLKPGERFMLSSPGFNKNWANLNPGFLQEELLANKSIKTLDILDEAYFQLKKKLKSDFLSYDASSLVLEVDENVLYEA